MSAQVIDLSSILEREQNPPKFISGESFFGRENIHHAVNDNEDISSQDDFDIEFLVDIVLDTVISRVRNSVKKKLDTAYFSILFEDEREEYGIAVLQTFSGVSFGFLSEETIATILEKRLLQLGIREKTQSIILEY